MGWGPDKGKDNDNDVEMMEKNGHIKKIKKGKDGLEKDGDKMKQRNFKKKLKV